MPHAYRDQIAVELTLKHLISDWEKTRDSVCEKSAQKEFGNGSMRPTAVAVCVTAETKKMIERIEIKK